MYFFTEDRQAENLPLAENLAENLPLLAQELATSHDDGAQSIQTTLPKPPAHLPGNLQQYLLTVQEAVWEDLGRRGPHLRSRGLMGAQVESYHRHIFDCCNQLLQKINDLQSLFILVAWVLRMYQR